VVHEGGNPSSFRNVSEVVEVSDGTGLFHIRGSNAFNTRAVQVDKKAARSVMYCSVVQCGAVSCTGLHWGAVCCSVLQCVAVCCSVLQLVFGNVICLISETCCIHK